MKLKISYLLILLFASMSAHSVASPIEDTAAKAAAAYKASDYNGAIELYNQLIEKNNRTAGVYYNLGNAYAKNHDYGNAMLCYERALRLEPGNDEIKNNLDYVSSQVEAQNRADLKGKPISVAEDDPWFFRSIYNKIAIDSSSDTWAMIAGFAFILFIIFVAEYIFVKNILMRKIGFFGAISMIGCCVLFLVFSYCAKKESKRTNEGIIMAEKVELLADPNEKGKSTTTLLNRGTKVEILKTEGGVHDHPDWYDVRLNSENAGWIKAADIEII